MNHDDYCRRLREVMYTAGMNARYHQRLEARFDLLDKIIRIAVAILAIVGLVFAFPEFDKLAPGAHIAWIGFGVAVLSLIVAGILNIVPVVEKAKFYGEMFRKWSDLRKDAVLEEHKTCEGCEDHHVDRLAELLSKMESLHAEEPFPSRKLLEKCQGDENEAEWGKGIRTAQQTEAERQRRRQSETTSPSPSPSVVGQE